MSRILSTGEGGGVAGWGLVPEGGAWWRPPKTATAAGSTHPTGMHSCYLLMLHLNHAGMKQAVLYAA